MAPSWLSWLVVADLWAQPPLPPEEQPSILGSVVRVSRTDGLVLDSGLSAPLAGEFELRGADSLEAVEPGALVEVRRDADGLVTHIQVLPRLAQRMPLVEAASPRAPISRFWWTYEGRDFRDSIYTAESEIPLQVAAIALEGVVAYMPTTARDAAEFAVLDHAGVVVWSRHVVAGEIHTLRCALSGAKITLRCRRDDGSVPDHTHCVWGSPIVVLKELGLVSVRPSAVAELVSKLDAGLGDVDAGVVGVAQPKIIGASPQTGLDLQGDLLIALSRRHPVSGFLPWEVEASLSDAQREAARTAHVSSVAASELRYSPEGSVVRLRLLHVASGELLASSEVTIKP